MGGGAGVGGGATVAAGGEDELPPSVTRYQIPPVLGGGICCGLTGGGSAGGLGGSTAGGAVTSALWSRATSAVVSAGALEISGAPFEVMIAICLGWSSLRMSAIGMRTADSGAHRVPR